MVKLYVGITDGEWYQHLSGRPDLTEVNFWAPGGSHHFRALQPGEFFLFKLKSPNNFIVGGGLFVSESITPISVAWSAFGDANGAGSLDALRRRIARIRGERVDPHADPNIGCRILEQVTFFRRDQWIAVPESWAPNTQQGRTYDAATVEGRALWDTVTDAFANTPAADPAIRSARYGAPILFQPRLGQGAFRVGVTDAYGRRCAVTGERTLPILDAAHIRPYGDGGEHEIANGVLLRTDVHRLFDLGYVTVAPDGRFEVGKRLKDEFENGKHYYDMHGRQVWMPADPRHRPSPDALEWHRLQRFRG
jgi:putative restriction endonuclease